ncbi:MAG: hypothetical protein J6Y49_01600 [Alphaproteobacteria bacterium]|nr:hypothetical protein [Alphaproteobacteria bacterium]
MTEKTYKKPSEMTAEEKAGRILRLKHKFYDISTVPSLLLQDELEHRALTTDAKLMAGIEKLQTLEHKVTTLTKQYEAKVLEQKILLAPQHQQQLAQMNDAHTLERNKLLSSTNPFIRARAEQLRTKQEKEQAKLLAKQAATLNEVRNKAAKKLNQAQGRLFSLFMTYVHQIYK